MALMLQENDHQRAVRTVSTTTKVNGLRTLKSPSSILGARIVVVWLMIAETPLPGHFRRRGHDEAGIHTFVRITKLRRSKLEMTQRKTLHIASGWTSTSIDNTPSPRIRTALARYPGARHDVAPCLAESSPQFHHEKKLLYMNPRD